MSESRHAAEGADQANENARREAFVALLTQEQARLHRYILTLLADHDAAGNILQETNLVLWRKVDEFQPGTSFSAWARKVAYWQALAYIRDAKRDRLVFSEELARQLAARPALSEEESERRLALRHCLAELPRKHLDLIKARYGGDLPIAALANNSNEKPSAVKVRLHRIRRALLSCIEKQMAVG